MLALGISLAVAAWSPAFVAALQVFGVLFLLFVGLIFSLVGYSTKKAERSCVEAIDEFEQKSKREANETASVETS